jgi:hypothetical protein
MGLADVVRHIRPATEGLDPPALVRQYSCYGLDSSSYDPAWCHERATLVKLLRKFSWSIRAEVERLFPQTEPRTALHSVLAAVLHVEEMTPNFQPEVAFLRSGCGLECVRPGLQQVMVDFLASRSQVGMVDPCEI